MTYEFLLINLGYGIVFLALAIKEVLWLRVTLSIAQGIIMYNNVVIAENYITAGWNLVFVIVNMVQIIIIYHDRKPRFIPEEYLDIYNGVFTSLTSKEFLYLLKMGDVIKTDKKNIISAGEYQTDLLFMLNGQCTVIKDKNQIATIRRGQFIGELSFITSQPASATVRADGKISYLSWNQEQMKTIKHTNPSFYSKFHHALTRDIANKIVN